ncbi:MAG: hypothetical protein EAY75_00235 [Bacteroidetes bacterium]|nr:MAG: hypothetical protein EAY75_00235 [Bacteroidota bacterium]
MLEMYVELPCNLQKTDLLTEAFNVQFTGQKARPADLQTIKKQSTERYKIGLTQNDAWLNQSVDAQFLGADRSRFL